MFEKHKPKLELRVFKRQKQLLAFLQAVDDEGLEGISS